MLSKKPRNRGLSYTLMDHLDHALLAKYLTGDVGTLAGGSSGGKKGGARKAAGASDDRVAAFTGFGGGAPVQPVSEIEDVQPVSEIEIFPVHGRSSRLMLDLNVTTQDGRDTDSEGSEASTPRFEPPSKHGGGRRTEYRARQTQVATEEESLSFSLQRAETPPDEDEQQQDSSQGAALPTSAPQEEESRPSAPQSSKRTRIKLTRTVKAFFSLRRSHLILFSVLASLIVSISLIQSAKRIMYDLILSNSSDSVIAHEDVQEMFALFRMGSGREAPGASEDSVDLEIFRRLLTERDDPAATVVEQGAMQNYMHGKNNQDQRALQSGSSSSAAEDPASAQDGYTLRQALEVRRRLKVFSTFMATMKLLTGLGTLFFGLLALRTWTDYEVSARHLAKGTVLARVSNKHCGQYVSAVLLSSTGQ